MEKSYLYRRHNVYWVRVRVPDKVRDIVGKTQLSKRKVGVINQPHHLLRQDYYAGTQKVRKITTIPERNISVIYGRMIPAGFTLI